MFTAPRFVVVDDRKQHLDAIVTAFQELGAACMGIHYDSARPLKPRDFSGVRVLCLDLHLMGGVPSTDNRAHYAHIAEILESNVSKTGGPFVLVIWTEHPHTGNELRDYLRDSLDANKPWVRPVACLTLSKGDFINLETGKGVDANALRKKLEDAVMRNPQFAALLNWEMEVLNAAGDALAELFALIPAAERTEQAIGPALDAVLSRLAREAVGAKNVETDPRAAINSALAPILADRIMNQTLAGGAAAAMWKRAVTRHSDNTLGPASPGDAGRINRMLHVAVPSPENIRPADWGAVVDCPQEWLKDSEMLRLFGITATQLLGGEFRLEKEGRDRCRPCLVRIGAACDHAQSRSGPVTYLFAIESAPDAKRKMDTSGQPIPLPAAIWHGPVLVLSEADGPFTLQVHVRFPVTVPVAEACHLRVRYRLRESLLMDLITSATRYLSRPGIVRLPVE